MDYLGYLNWFNKSVQIIIKTIYLISSLALIIKNI